MFKEITSPDNPAFKKAAGLKLKKERDKRGQYLIEGPNLIREALLCRAEVTEVYATWEYIGVQSGAEVAKEPPAQHTQFSCDNPDSEAEEILALLEKQNIPLRLLPSRLFQKLSDTQTPQGILAVAVKPNRSEEGFFVAGGNYLVLDRLQDPGNLGTLLRTAAAAGYAGAVIVKGTGDIYSPKTVRSAAGALFRLPVFFCAGEQEAARLLRKHGKRIFVTAVNGGSPYFDKDLKQDNAVVIGNEGNGVSDFFLQEADEKISIPMVENTESLNAAVAAGIIMYEAVRQRYKNL